MDNTGSILDRLLDGRVPILARLASPTADSLLIVEFTSPETLQQNLTFVTRAVENGEGTVGLTVEGVLVAAFAGPSAAVRTAVELMQSSFGDSGIRAAIH